MLIRNTGFWLVFAAFILPSASHVLTIYALSFYLLEHYAGNPGYVSTAELMNTLPIIAGFLLIGTAVDRFHRKRLALVALLLRFGFAAGILICLGYGFIETAFALLFCRMLFHKLFVTMEMAIIQGLLEAHQFVKVASLKQIVNGTFAITGSFAALFIYRKYGITGIMALDCLLTLAAFLLMHRVKLTDSACMPNGTQHSLGRSLRSMWIDTKHGFNYVWSTPMLRSFLFTFVVYGVINAILATLPLYSMRYVLTEDTKAYQHYTVLFSFLLGISFVLGGTISTLLKRLPNTKQTVKISLLLLSILLPLMGQIHSPLPFFAITFVVGLLVVMNNITIGGWLPQIVSPAFMGRTYAPPRLYPNRSACWPADGFIQTSFR